MAIQVKETQKIPKQLQPKEISAETHHNQSFKNQRQREDLESSKREQSHHIQGNPDTAFHRFLSRNLAGQERMGRYIQRKKKTQLIQEYSTQQSCHSEIIKRYPDKS